MTMTVDSIFKDALKLSGDGRVALAERLIESVEPDAAVFAVQVAEAMRRAEEMASGAVQGIPGGVALRQVRESILQRSGA